MEKFISYGKLSKKKQRELDRAKRRTWGGLSPVTRKHANSKAYHRQRTQNRKRDVPDPVSFYLCRHGA